MTGKIQQKTFKESDSQTAQRATHLPLCTQYGPMCICAYDETPDSADLYPSTSLTFAADCTREFLLDCTETSGQASLSPPRTCTMCHPVHPRSSRTRRKLPALNAARNSECAAASARSPGLAKQGGTVATTACETWFRPPPATQVSTRDRKVYYTTTTNKGKR